MLGTTLTGGYGDGVDETTFADDLLAVAVAATVAAAGAVGAAAGDVPGTHPAHRDRSPRVCRSRLDEL